tara:strand:+ start:73 stop:192 length:120 start_codon:yes stop_codon:yes gene_type:complete
MTTEPAIDPAAKQFVLYSIDAVREIHGHDGNTEIVWNPS